MRRKPCCDKEGVKRGAWSVAEDQILANLIQVHGEGKWRDVPKRAGFNRCGKSCRLRCLNYLRPDIKRGNISEDEEDLIIRLRNLLGNRWVLIAARLPGRTDNEIKNFWKTNLSKRLQQQNYTHSNNPSRLPTTTTTTITSPTIFSIAQIISSAQATKTSSLSSDVNPADSSQSHAVIRPKARRCTKKFIVPKANNAAEWGSQNNRTSSALNIGEDHDQKMGGLSGSHGFLEDFDLDIERLLLPEEAQAPCTSFEKLQENVGAEVNHTHQDWMVSGFFQPDNYDDVDFSFLDAQRQ